MYNVYKGTKLADLTCNIKWDQYKPFFYHFYVTNICTIKLKSK